MSYFWTSLWIIYILTVMNITLQNTLVCCEISKKKKKEEKSTNILNSTSRTLGDLVW